VKKLLIAAATAVALMTTTETPLAMTQDDASTPNSMSLGWLRRPCRLRLRLHGRVIKPAQKARAQLVPSGVSSHLGQCSPSP
jgi:hypothetical protein